MANPFDKLQMPVANAQAAQQQAAANALQVQSQMGQVGAGQAMAGGAQMAQQLGTQLAARQAALTAQQQAGRAQQTTAQAQLEFRNRQLQQRDQNNAIRRQLEQRRLSQEKELRNKGRDIQDKIVDAQYKFEQTARGIQFADQRQYEDYLTWRQATEQEWMSHQQKVMQESQRKLRALEYAYSTFERIEQQLFKSEQSKANMSMLTRVRQRKEEIAEEQARARRKAGRAGKILGAAKAVAGIGIVAASIVAAPATGGTSAVIAGSVGAQMAAGGIQEASTGQSMEQS